MRCSSFCITLRTSSRNGVPSMTLNTLRTAKSVKRSRVVIAPRRDDLARA